MTYILGLGLLLCMVFIMKFSLTRFSVIVFTIIYEGLGLVFSMIYTKTGIIQGLCLVFTII